MFVPFIHDKTGSIGAVHGMQDDADAADVYFRYQDTEFAKRQGVLGCWVYNEVEVEEGKRLELVLGQPPEGWSFDVTYLDPGQRGARRR